MFQTEISQINTRVDDVLGKMKTLKDQMKQMSEDQNQMIDILRSIAEKQVGEEQITVIEGCKITAKNKNMYFVTQGAEIVNIHLYFRALNWTQTMIAVIISQLLNMIGSVCEAKWRIEEIIYYQNIILLIYLVNFD